MSIDKDAKEPIEILLVSDSKYAAFLATTILSIVKSAARSDAFRFHIVDGGLTPNDLAKLDAMSQELGAEICWYRPDANQYQREFDVASGTAFPVIVNYRLFAAQFLPKTMTKILYLDVDVIALKSLRSLWEYPLDDSLCAAVPDTNIAQKRLNTIEFPSDRQYFNSGVMLINLQKWRDENWDQIFLTILADKKNVLSFPDQDVLNLAAARSSYAQLDKLWNCLPRDYVEGETCILHYCGRRHRAPHLKILYDFVAQTPYKKLPFQGARARFARICRRALYDLLSLFVIFSAKRRRALRKYLNVR